jgi:hypothetical protein
MHMAMVIASGIVILGLFTLFTYLWGGAGANLATGAKLFIPVWLVIALVNMWVGVTKAGYSVKEELPILLIVFAIPAVIAAFAIWRLSR